MTSSNSPTAAISTRLLSRVIIVLIAVWSLLEGTVLVGFHGVGSGALGAGVNDPAGQRLLGVHLLVLAPAYLLVAWRPERYQAFIWLPFAAQLAFAMAVAYAIVSSDTDFGDGILVVAVSAIFAGLLAFVWITEQRSVARAKMEAESDDPLPDDV
ncbi:MAG TPA: hypothetical protein VJB57_04945 [Dehalococcoidia bacterium]|nr:hypothetical protein [Dehalococcoidia bacterium]